MSSQPLLPASERRPPPVAPAARALAAAAAGCLPSTAQAVAALRAAAAAPPLRPTPADAAALGPAGRQLAGHARAAVGALADVLADKNPADAVQDALWLLRRPNPGDDNNTPLPQQGDYHAISYGLRGLAVLTLANADFRALVGDAADLCRQLLADPTLLLAAGGDGERGGERGGESDGERAAETGATEPSGDAHQSAHQPDARQPDISHPAASPPSSPPPNRPPSPLSPSDAAAALSADAAAAAAAAARASRASHNDTPLSRDFADLLLYRLRRTVADLHKRDDYHDSLSALARLFRHYARLVGAGSAPSPHGASAGAVAATIDRLFDAVAVAGDPAAWLRLRHLFARIALARQPPDVDRLASALARFLYVLLSDPSGFDRLDSAVDHFARAVGPDPPARPDLDALLAAARDAVASLWADPLLCRLADTVRALVLHVRAGYADPTSSLIPDLAHVFLPLLVRSVRRLPLPRLEISTPDIDLLLEGIVLEPPADSFSSSFFPPRLSLVTRADLHLDRRPDSRSAVSRTHNRFSLAFSGLNARASGLGYWLRVHQSALLPAFVSAGRASFALDPRGTDVALDLELSQDRLEQLLILHGVRVHIHKLDYAVDSPAPGWFSPWWLLKPLLKHLIRRTLEQKLADFIVATVHVANRELVFARERFLAARFAAADDPLAVARLVLGLVRGGIDGEISARVGLGAHRHRVFDNLHTPAYCPEPDAPAPTTWRSDAFDLHWERGGVYGSA